MNRRGIGSILISLTFFSCFTIRNYEQIDSPIISSNNIKDKNNSDSITVLIFNIKKSENMMTAIEELEKFNKKVQVDIYLLQEMNEAAVREIADHFHLNYLFIPIVYNKMMRKDVGNAILSSSPVINPEKLIFPHKKIKNGRLRHAAIGEITINNKKILVYSVHTETSSMSRKKRLEQFDAIIQHAGKNKSLFDGIIIGGDFNTLYKKDNKMLCEKFHQSGISYATDSVGFTARALWGLIKPTEDHIFYYGMNEISSGKISDSKSSDHLPLYSTFTLIY